MKKQEHFSLRKLSIGLASVVIGISFFTGTQVVHADTVQDSQAAKNNNVKTEEQEASVAKSRINQTTSGEISSMQTKIPTVYVNKPNVIFNLFKENGKYYLLVKNKKYTIISFKQLVSKINYYLLNSLSSNA